MNLQSLFLMLSISFTSLCQTDSTLYDMDPRFAAVYDSLKMISDREENLRPTWKTGDNDSKLRGVLEYIFIDRERMALLELNLRDLHITGDDAIQKVPLKKWLAEYFEDTINTNIFKIRSRNSRYSFFFG